MTKSSASSNVPKPPNHPGSPLPPPDRFPRRILVCVSGLTPQIVTETLYGLVTARPRAFVPTEVHLVTTKEGADRARLTLLSADPGWFHRIVSELDLGSIRFDTETIHVLRDSSGRELCDIRTPEDNEAAADMITELLRHWTSDENAALHVSLAGGRKTMGFYVAYALSLYGRPQDRLSHVLVSQEFEGLHEFFYPTPYSRIIYDRENKPLDTRDARVTLAEIPFVRLRHGLPERLLEGRATFSETVLAAQSAFGPPKLTIDVPRRRVMCGDRQVRMRPVDMGFLLWMAERRRSGNGPVERTLEDPEEFLDSYAKITSPMSGTYERVCNALRHGEGHSEYFDEHKSRVNRAIRAALGEPACHPYLIVGVGRRPDTRFGLLGLSPDDIEIIGCSDRPVAGAPGHQANPETRNAGGPPALDPIHFALAHGTKGHLI
ncbi:MAG: TIGR02584 family CRISPR-associated protein [Candidatus Dadabacteria bacterium]|nr:MAG: TIGR02584 family CRISPR-associated protein [Candidatus Dadabacteria bacterium]